MRYVKTPSLLAACLLLSLDFDLCPTSQTLTMELEQSENELISSLPRSLSPLQSAQLRFSMALIKKEVQDELSRASTPELTIATAQHIIDFELNGRTVRQIIEEPEAIATLIKKRVGRHALYADIKNSPTQPKRYHVVKKLDNNSQYALAQ